MTNFDGGGGLTQVDCTGTFTFYPNPTVAADSSPAITVYFVICKGGQQINTVVSGSPNTPPFVAALISTGTRLFDVEEGELRPTGPSGPLVRFGLLEAHPLRNRCPGAQTSLWNRRTGAPRR